MSLRLFSLLNPFQSYNQKRILGPKWLKPKCKWSQPILKNILGNYVFVDGINDEFAALKQCGVAMSFHNLSYNIFNVIDAYKPGDMFLRKIKIPKNYKVPDNNNTDCPICLATFADDEHVARMPCHVRPFFFE